MAQYQPGQWIDVSIEVTTSHLGYFVFKICKSNHWEDDPEQECFDRYFALYFGHGYFVISKAAAV